MRKIYVLILALFLEGCATKSPKNSEIYKSKNTISSVIELPNKMQILQDRFVKRFELPSRAEYYLQSEKVGFSWQKMLTINHSKKLKIDSYKSIMQKQLESGKFGKVKIELSDVANNAVQGYIVLEPLGKFNEYEINLIHAKQLTCGLIDIRYAFKVEPKNSNKIAQIAYEKLENFMKEIPEFECR